MLSTDKVIIVEGKYDKLRISEFIDALIIPTNGFRIFKDKKKLNLLKRLAKEKGVIIMTDSDSAGFVIRNYLKGCIDEKSIKNVYVPTIRGKEKRKPSTSKEGLLGVEGLSEEIILNAMMKAGVFAQREENSSQDKITNSDLYDDGLVGRAYSKILRNALLNYLNLPEYISTKALLEILNHIVDKSEYKSIVGKIKEEEK